MVSPRVLAPIHPNAGLTVRYRSRLLAELAELQRSVLYWVKASWRKQPRLAQDADPIAELQATFRRLGRRWLRKFDALAPALAERFVRDATGRVDQRFRRQLQEAGFTIEFVTSRAVRDAYRAAVAENVSLIQSVAAQHLDGVERAVLRSVATGRDLAAVTKDLQEQYGVTRRRATLIARDQNNKATAVITKVRQEQLGITQARWRHSAGGRHPRPSHVAADGTVYDVAKGWFDPDAREWVWPGTLINCRCVSQAVLPGFE